MSLIKLHIDHLGNPDGDIWAVQAGRQYYTAHHVESFIDLETATQDKQPRAFLQGYGVVRVKTLHGKTFITLEGE